MIRQITSGLSFIKHHPFARRHFAVGLLKWIYWQILSRIYSKPKRVKFLEGVEFMAQRGMKGITGNIYAGLHEFNDMAFLIHCLREGDYFIDVGANVGSYTLLAAGVKRAHVTAFEPAPSTYEWLATNVRLNNLDDLVECRNEACASNEGKLKFSTSEDTTNHTLGENEIAEYVTISCVELDSMKCAPDILKIDVEGFESEVLAGASNILEDNKLKAIIIEINGSGQRYGYSDADIHRNLLNKGFLPYDYNPYQRKLEKRQSYGEYNTIYVRDYDTVSDRLKSSPPFNLWGEKI